MSLPVTLQTIRHPVLSSLGRYALHEFETARSAYLDAIQERQGQPGGENLIPISLKASIKPELLWSMIDLGELGDDITDLPDITEAILEEWLAKHHDKHQEVSLDQLNRAVSKLYMDDKEPDPEQRVIKLFMAYTRLLRRYRMGDFVKKESEVCVRHIVPILRPRALQNRIKRDLEIEKKELYQNFRGFYQHVIQRAIACEDFVPISNEINIPGGLANGPRGRPTSNAPTTRPQTDPNQGSGPIPGTIVPAPPIPGGRTPNRPGWVATNSGQDSSTSVGTASSVSELICLNNECSDHHSIGACQKSS